MKINLIKWNVWKLTATLIFIYITQFILVKIIPITEISYKLHFHPINFIGVGLIYCIILVWIYQVASYANNALNPNLRLDYSKFKISYWIFVALLIFQFFHKIVLCKFLVLKNFLNSVTPPHSTLCIMAYCLCK